MDKPQIGEIVKIIDSKGVEIIVKILHSSSTSTEYSRYSVKVILPRMKEYTKTVFSIDVPPTHRIERLPEQTIKLIETLFKDKV